MTGHDLKIWLVTHGYTQKQLAEALGVTVKTINTACNGRPSKILSLAVKALENKGVK